MTLVPFPQRNNDWRAYAKALLIVLTCTGLAGLMFSYFSLPNLILVYLVGVVVVAVRFGRGPSILASVLSVAAFDFFFVPPFMTFAVSDTEYLWTFATMLLVALIVSNLTARIKDQAELARERERRTANLYAMSREFASSRSTDNLVTIASHHIAEVFHTQVVLLLPDASHKLVAQRTKNAPALDDHEQGVAQWVYEHSQVAGAGTKTLPGSKGVYLPLLASQGVAGVIGVYPADPGSTTIVPDLMSLLETFANQTALAIERARLAEETEQTRLEIETERMRNALLSSVSHDLRTPLVSITGAVSSLLDNEDSLDRQSRHDLAQVAYEEADRLNRLLGNLLDMTRLESGGIHVEKEWQMLDEVVGMTLTYLDNRIARHPITLAIPPDLPFVPIDGVLIEQVLLNLLDNAIKYTPEDSPIQLSARAQDHAVLVEVADHGPGLPAGNEERVFDKFFRGRPTSAGGVGLGLTICRGIVEAHGGRIWAENRPEGGTLFRFTLPLGENPPEVKSLDD
ncbi:MAG TPA: DUF4118 domain-containing protein [Aggregatilineales bacterium]|nr:DUF4118 domain-containing protein [Aggregatilineales bacterium]